MGDSPTSRNSVAAAIKIYLFPSLVTILAMMIWRDVSELRADVKSLLAQASVDKTKIENLERILYMSSRKPTAYLQPYDKLLFKHEDFYNIEDKIIKE
jgi:hypothetical protein